MSIFRTPEFPKNISVLFRNLAISVSCLALVGCSVPKIDVNRIVKATPIAIPSATSTPLSAEPPTVTPTRENSVEVDMTLGDILIDLLEGGTLPVKKDENEKLIPIELAGYPSAEDLKSAVRKFLDLKKEKEIDIRVVDYTFHHSLESINAGLYSLDDLGELVDLGEGGFGYGVNSLSEIDFAKYLKKKEGVMFIAGGSKYLIVLGENYDEDIRDNVLLVSHPEVGDWFAYAKFLFVISKND
jgi:hypothetical protein